jgi:hypothetical protein
MGRGGSGNWYQPSELQKEGTFNQPADSTAIPTSSKPQISTPWHPEGQELPVARSGRGGAGNFVWKSDEQVRKEREGRELDELKKKETVSQEVKRRCWHDRALRSWVEISWAEDGEVIKTMNNCSIVVMNTQVFLHLTVKDIDTYVLLVVAHPV